MKKDISRVCCHPTNRKIVELLSEENLSFTQIKNKLDGSSDSGKFGYHLRRLSGFIEFDRSKKKYFLTYRGTLLFDIIRGFNERVSAGILPFSYGEQMVLGDHAAAYYNSESFKRDIAFPFLRSGLAKGYAAVYAVDEEELDSELLALKKYGLDPEILPKGALTVMSSYEFCLLKGEVKTKTITENLQRLVEEKKAAGFKGVYVAGEMKVFLDYDKISELWHYEESLGRQFSFDLSRICLYDKKRFAEKGILRIFNDHGSIISEHLCGEIPNFKMMITTER